MTSIADHQNGVRAECADMNAPSIKHKLIAILAADAAGFSRLMASDEHATLTTLDAARAVFRAHIESHQGRVIDMAGDSVLAAFETATGAVGAAMEIQQALELAAATAAPETRMQFRIGVHLGDVIEKSDGTVYGDGVNVAARLEGLAQPGGVVVSEAVQGVVAGRVGATFVDKGHQQLKNIVQPIRAYAVVSGDAPVSLPADGEVAALRDPAARLPCRHRRRRARVRSARGTMAGRRNFARARGRPACLSDASRSWRS